MAGSIKKIELDALDTTSIASFDASLSKAKRELAQAEFVQPVIVVDLTLVDTQALPGTESNRNGKPFATDGQPGRGDEAQGRDEARVVVVSARRDKADDIDDTKRQPRQDASQDLRQDANQDAPDTKAAVQTTAVREGLTVSRVTLPVATEGSSVSDIVMVTTDGSGGGALVANVTDETGRTKSVIMSLDEQGGISSDPVIVLDTQDAAADGATAFGVIGSVNASTGERSLILIVPDSDTPELTIAISRVDRVETINAITQFANGQIISIDDAETTSHFGGAVQIETGSTGVIVWLDAGRNVGDDESVELEANFGLILSAQATSETVSSDVRSVTLVFVDGTLTALAIDGQTVDDFDGFVRELAAAMSNPVNETGWLALLDRNGAFTLKSNEFNAVFRNERELITNITTASVQDNQIRELTRREQERDLEQRRGN